jgi:hypothetical protein
VDNGPKQIHEQFVEMYAEPLEVDDVH